MYSFIHDSGPEVKFSGVVGGVMPPEDTCFWIPRAWEYIIWQRGTRFIDEIKIANHLNVKEDYTALSWPMPWKATLNVEEAGRRFSVTVKLHARCHQWRECLWFWRRKPEAKAHADPEGGKGKETDSSRTSWKNEVLLSPLFQTSETLSYVQPSVFLFFAFFF